MKISRPTHPAHESAGDGKFTPPGLPQKMAGPTAWQGLAAMGALGFTLVGCTFLGLFAGYYLDRWLKTSPLFTILLLLFGIAAGLINIFISTSRARPPPRSAKDAPQSDADQNQQK